MGRLGTFLLQLVLDPSLAARYGCHPQEEQEAAGLTPAERCLLSTGRVDLLTAALRSELSTPLDAERTSGRASAFYDFLLDLRSTDLDSALLRSHLSPAEHLMVRFSDLSTISDAVIATLAMCSYPGSTPAEEFVRLITRGRSSTSSV